MPRLHVNGTFHPIAVERERSLLYVLREELGLTAAKYGCGEGECGACTVIVDGEAVRSCRMPVREAIGREVVTVEGLAQGGALHPVQQAFLDGDALQCGFCTPGMIASAVALLQHDPSPSDARVREAMDHNLCRCCTYPRILAAIADAKAGTKREPAPPRPVSDTTVAPPAAVPWGLRSPEERDWFGRFGDGVVAVVPPDRGGPPVGGRPQLPSGGAWVHVGAGGAHGFVGKVEVGQGTRGALSLLLAEELGLPVDAVRVVMGDTDLVPWDIGTFGSMSTPIAAQQLRRAAATARALVDELGGRDQLAGQRRVVVAGEAEPHAPSSWTLAGHDARQPDTALAVTGARKYVSDIHLPGMLAGKVLRPPRHGATLRSVDTRAAAAMPGVTVLEDGQLVAVAAADPLQAQAALDAIVAEWDEAAQPSEREVAAWLAERTHAGEGFWSEVHHSVGDVAEGLRGAATTVEASYTGAYIAHVPLECHTSIAEWSGDGRLTLRVGSQTPFLIRREVAEALGLPEAEVRVLIPPTGSGFGGKHDSETSIAAARLAKQAGRPVKISFTREEEFTWAYLRPVAFIELRAGLSDDGKLVAWSHANLNAGSAGVFTPYQVPHQKIDYQPAESPLPQGAYRALAATANNFAREAFMDELAEKAGVDPFEFRLRHLADERLAAVLRAVAENAGWSSRERASGRGMGIACGLEKGSRVATCVTLRVDDDGRLTLERIVTGFECGAIVHPDNLRNQVEGATVMGLGGALWEAIRFDRGRVLNPRLSQYRVPHFKDVPSIEVLLLDRPDLPSVGGGETPIIAVAPAIAGAIFAATGKRMRAMPMAPGGFVRR